MCSKAMMGRLAIITFFLILGFQFVTPVKAYYPGFTHAVYIETVVGTWCPYCRADLPAVADASKVYSSSLNFVMFHVSASEPDEWVTPYAMQKLKQYRSNQTPTHALDAGFKIRLGSIDGPSIEEVGKRTVHRVTLAVLKRINSGTLSFDTSIKEEDNKIFSGKVTAIVVENGLSSHGLMWNSVFRDYLLNQDVTIDPGQYKTFSGSWPIPPGVNSANVQIIVAAFDAADQSENGDPFAIQSVSDAYSGAVVPEFNAISFTTAVAVLASVIVLKAASNSRSRTLRNRT